LVYTETNFKNTHAPHPFNKWPWTGGPGRYITITALEDPGRGVQRVAECQQVDIQPQKSGKSTFLNL